MRGGGPSPRARGSTRWCPWAPPAPAPRSAPPPCSHRPPPLRRGPFTSPTWTISSRASSRGGGRWQTPMGEAGGEGGGGSGAGSSPSPPAPSPGSGARAAPAERDQCHPHGEPTPGGGPQAGSLGGGSSGATAKLGWPGVKALEVPERENGAALPPGLGLGWWRRGSRGEGLSPPPPAPGAAGMGGPGWISTVPPPLWPCAKVYFFWFLKHVSGPRGTTRLRNKRLVFGVLTEQRGWLGGGEAGLCPPLPLHPMPRTLMPCTPGPCPRQPTPRRVVQGHGELQLCPGRKPQGEGSGCPSALGTPSSPWAGPAL